MDNSSAKNNPVFAKIMSNYLGIICCRNAPHTNKFKQHCKGCGWICQQCGQNSTHLRYCYYSPCTTNFTYCVIHFQTLLIPLIHSWKHSQLVIFDPKTKAMTDLTLKTPSIYMLSP